MCCWPSRGGARLFKMVCGPTTAGRLRFSHSGIGSAERRATALAHGGRKRGHTRCKTGRSNGERADHHRLEDDARLWRPTSLCRFCPAEVEHTSVQFRTAADLAATQAKALVGAQNTMEDFYVTSGEAHPIAQLPGRASGCERLQACERGCTQGQLV